MRSAVYQYLTEFEPFVIFSSDHIWALIISFLMVICLPIYSKKYLTEKQQNMLGIILGFAIMSNYIIWVSLELIAGTFEIKQHLPFHLCRFANLTIPLVMLNRNYRLYEVLYFWGFSGVLQAAISPDAPATFPHFYFIRFWIGHSGLMLALVYATVVYGMRPTWKSFWRSFAALNLFFLIAIPVNLILDANYFWICGKPPVPTLLDYMGPWPWYILVGEFVALGHFVLAYSPFCFMKKRIITQ